jgi:anaerobic magnesium-protoporphyrin IX monomethyl ester cyclase
MMKITFLIPPVLDHTQDVDRCFGCNYVIYFLPLLGMLYPATVLKQQGYSVAIRDFAARGEKEKAFREFAASDDSDIYCFYTVFLSQRTDCLASDIIRAARPSARFIFLGPQPTWDAEVFLDCENAYVVRGEPDLMTWRLVDALQNGSDLGGIQGLSYRASSGVVHNAPAPFIPDLDALPIPDRTLIDHRPYSNPKLHSKPHTAVLTSRGCSAQCWYCVPNSLSYARELEYKRYHRTKPPVRMHSSQRVVEELSRIAASGFKSVSVIDDQFLWDEERTVRISDGIKNLKLEWSCLARCDRVSDRTAEAMASAGCAYVDLGTESFDQKVLDAVGKNIRADETERAVRILKKHGIGVELNILFGAAPEETEATIQWSLSELKRLDVDYVLFSIANPFPGTDFYAAAKANGWLAFGDYVPVDPAKSSIISYPHLSKERLEEIVARAYRNHYLHPRTLWREFLKTRSLSDFADKCATGVKFIHRNFWK